MLLNERLKKLREEKGVLQKDISSLLEVSQNLISAMESGKRLPSWKNLKKLISYYEIDKKTKIEILKEWFQLRLNDDMFECHQEIQITIKEEMTKVELDDYVASERDKNQEFEIYKNDGLTSMISFLREMDPERRKKSVEMFVDTARLPMNKFVFLNEIFDTLIEESDEEIFKKSFGIISMLKTK